jgi:hypothetical protein
VTKILDGTFISSCESIADEPKPNRSYRSSFALADIIKNDPPFHVLIDTGALITGMSNYDVAKYMLTNGLSEEFDGVVFLDHRDRKMVLMR